MKNAIFFVCFTFLVGNINASIIPRIVGGSDAEISDFPYVASLRYRDKYYCVAVIIGERFVVTAAHCINRNVVPPYNEVTVSTGTASSRELGHSHRIAMVMIHPRWIEDKECSFVNDIAVIKIIGTIRFDQHQQKIELPSHDVLSGATAMFAGWGYTAPRRSNFSVKLQKLETKLQTYTDCQAKQYIRIYNTQLCAYKSRTTGPCLGDSGGPLVVGNELVGILSWVRDGHCAAGIPEVYTNIYAYKDFIRTMMTR